MRKIIMDGGARVGCGLAWPVYTYRMYLYSSTKKFYNKCCFGVGTSIDIEKGALSQNRRGGAMVKLEQCTIILKMQGKLLT